MTSPILLIESVASLRMVYGAILERAGNKVRSAETLREGLSSFHERPPCVIILDGLIEGADHEATLRHFQSAHPGTKVLMTLPQTALKHRQNRFERGIFDILVKPFDELRLLAAVADARTEILRARLAATDGDQQRVPMSLMGSSPAITTLRERLAAFAQSTAPVMISGDEGSGKTDCARHLHGQRKQGKSDELIEVTCRAATPQSLQDDLNAADPEATLLLHEIDSLTPITAQYLLDRIKTDGLHVKTVISTVEGSVLDALTRAAHAKELIHRLNALPLNLPPLSQRQSDTRDIAISALPELCALESRGPMELSPEAAAELSKYDWPGNIPQLINALRQIIVLYSGPQITKEMVNEVLQVPSERTDIATPLALGQTLADIERTVIEQTIQHHDGSVPKAAKSLGVSPSTLYRKRESWTSRQTVPE